MLARLLIDSGHSFGEKGAKLIALSRIETPRLVPEFRPKNLLSSSRRGIKTVEPNARVASIFQANDALNASVPQGVAGVTLNALTCEQLC